MSALQTTRLKRARTWVHDRFASILTWGIVGVSFVAGYVSFIRFTPSFYPDSRYYLAMSLWFGGDTQKTAHDTVVEFARHFKIAVPSTNHLFGWGLVQPRVVLPAIAAPFVKVLGPYGFTVTTTLITIALTIVLTIVLIKRYGHTAAAATMLLVNASSYLMLFEAGMLTESLSALWSVLLVVAAWRFRRTRSRWLLVALGAITALSAFTRQATLIDAGAFLMAWVVGSIVARKNSDWMWPAIVVTATSVLAQVIQTVVFPFSQGNQFIESSGAHTLWGALLTIPHKTLSIVKSDFKSFATTDRVLLLLIVFAVIAMIVFAKHEESHLLFGAILAIGLYNVTNGTPTTFRYAIPGLVFYLLAFALLISRTNSGSRWLQRDPLPVAPMDGTPTVALQNS